MFSNFEITEFGNLHYRTFDWPETVTPELLTKLQKIT